MYKKNNGSLSYILATPYCLDFAFHMQGNPGDLIISAGERNGNMQTELTISGDQGINWLTQSVHISNYSDVVVRMILCSLLQRVSLVKQKPQPFRGS